MFETNRYMYQQTGIIYILHSIYLMPVWWYMHRFVSLYSKICDNSTIGNGKMELHNGNECKASANIYCNPGYELIGSNTTSCLITGLLEKRTCLIKGNILVKC